MLKKYVSVRGLAGLPRSRTVIGLSFVLLVLVGSGVFLSNMVSQHHSAHAARSSAIGGVSKTWYFAERRVGGGFREYITIGNPDPSTDCSATILQEDLMIMSGLPKATWGTSASSHQQEL